MNFRNIICWIVWISALLLMLISAFTANCLDYSISDKFFIAGMVCVFWIAVTIIITN